jgi:ribokinase
MPLPDELLRLTDICVPNEVEIEQLTGRHAVTLPEAEGAARDLLERGPGAIVLTIGDRGALLVDAEGAHHVPAMKVEAVDSTGAGDAFVGSLAVFIAEGFNLREATSRAVAIASLSVTRIGTQISFPDRGQAETFLTERGRLATA